MSSNLLNAKILCYLTPEANAAVAELVGLGLDPDLALSTLEKLWPEAAVFVIPSESSENEEE